MNTKYIGNEHGNPYYTFIYMCHMVNSYLKRALGLRSKYSLVMAALEVCWILGHEVRAHLYRRRVHWGKHRQAGAQRNCTANRQRPARATCAVGVMENTPVTTPSAVSFYRILHFEAHNTRSPLIRGFMRPCIYFTLVK